MRKRFLILPMVSAIASLGIALKGIPTADAHAPATEPDAVPARDASAATLPNSLVVSGEDVLGFLVTEQPDGTIVAAHTSHVSHASHASHHSHYSSR